jgi:hypothetical protein
VEQHRERRRARGKGFGEGARQQLVAAVIDVAEARQQPFNVAAVAQRFDLERGSRNSMSDAPHQLRSSRSVSSQSTRTAAG